MAQAKNVKPMQNNFNKNKNSHKICESFFINIF